MGYTRCQTPTLLWRCMDKARPQLTVFASLAKALDWYDVSLQSILKDFGMTSVNRTQSMILLHISGGITRPSDIAREMGTTRQNIHAMAKRLLAHRIIELVPDHDDGRSKQYAFSEDAQELRQTVLRILAYLDLKLSERIGEDAMKSLGRALAADWGEHITQAPAELARKGGVIG